MPRTSTTKTEPTMKEEAKVPKIEVLKSAIVDLGLQLAREAKEHNTPPSQGEVERVKALLDLYALMK